MSDDLIHSTWVDTTDDRDGNGEQHQAVCETCSWASRWVHDDEFNHSLNGEPYPDDEDFVPEDDDELLTPGDQAHGLAKELGHQHEEEA